MKAIRNLAWALAVLIPLTITPEALAANVFPGVGTVDYNESANTLTLIIPYQARNPYRVQWLNGQNRLVVDVEGMALGSNRAMYIGMGVVQQIRAARQKANSTRLIFDLQQSADLRTLTDAGSRTLTLTIFPRGGAPASSQQTYAPGPRPTRRPAPPLRGIVPSNPMPIARITPNPVLQPSFAPIEAPTPNPMAIPTPAPTYVPTPEPQESNEPTPEPTPSETTEAGPQEVRVFGSSLMLGGDLALSLDEASTTLNTTTAVSLIPGGSLDWVQMFGAGENFGFGLGVHGLGYTVEDQEALDAGLKLDHARQDFEGNLGIRGRLPLPAGLEVYLQPGALIRYVTVTNTAQAVDADGAVTGDPTTGAGSTYLDSGYMGYGAQVQAGLGWHAFGPLSLAVTGEYNALLAGSMGVAGTPTIFPLMGFRAGGEAQLDFGLFGMALGYNFTSYGHDDLSQTWTGPYAKIGIVY